MVSLWYMPTKNKAIATIFISNKGNDLYYYLSYNQKDNSVILLKEKKICFKIFLIFLARFIH